MAKNESALSLIGYIATLVGTIFGSAAAFTGLIMGGRSIRDTPEPTVTPVLKPTQYQPPGLLFSMHRHSGPDLEPGLEPGTLADI